jgi:hypothetical protein
MIAPKEIWVTVNDNGEPCIGPARGVTGERVRYVLLDLEAEANLARLVLAAQRAVFSLRVNVDSIRARNLEDALVPVMCFRKKDGA